MHRERVGARSWLLFVPHHIATPAPLVVVLGGIEWPASMTAGQFRVEPVAEAAGALVAYPEQVNGAWNAGDCCWHTGADDVRFLHQIRTTVGRLFRLDPQRQVIAGFSNGGMLAYYAACHDAGWRHIAVLGATLTGDCNAKHPFSITNFNGTADRSVAWDGSYSHRAQFSMPPVGRTDARLAAAFGCTNTRVHSTSRETRIVYSSCRRGVVVEDVRVQGLRHHFALREIDGYDFGPLLLTALLG